VLVYVGGYPIIDVSEKPRRRRRQVDCASSKGRIDSWVTRVVRDKIELIDRTDR